MASQKSRLDFDLTLHNTNGTSESSIEFWRPEKARERKRREAKDKRQNRQEKRKRRKGSWSHIAREAPSSVSIGVTMYNL